MSWSKQLAPRRRDSQSGQSSMASSSQLGHAWRGKEEGGTNYSNINKQTDTNFEESK